MFAASGTTPKTISQWLFYLYIILMTLNHFKVLKY
jgi:hypothetical protein